MSQQLHTAIKDVFTNFGVELVKTSKLVNYLSDYGAFKDVPEAQKLLKKLLDRGVGEKIYQLYENKQAWKGELDQIKKDYLKAESCDEKVLGLVLQSIAYGLGWVNSISSPLIKPQQAFDPILVNYDFAKQLSSLKTEYISMLYNLMKQPAGGLYPKSGYYTANALAQLALVEGKIAIAQNATGDKDKSWCRRMKNEALAKFHVSPQTVWTHVGLKVGLPCLLVIIGLCFASSYLYSYSAIKEYNDQMALGAEYMRNNEYQKAFDAYQAASLYDGSYHSGSYIEEAKDHQEEIANRIVKEDIQAVDDCLNNEDYAGAKQILSMWSPIRDMASVDVRLKRSEKKDEVDERIRSYVKTGREKLIASISSNKGKLNNDSKQLLESLLKADPQNYWLNFILNKSNEKTGK